MTQAVTDQVFEGEVKGLHLWRGVDGYDDADIGQLTQGSAIKSAQADDAGTVGAGDLDRTQQILRPGPGVAIARAAVHTDEDEYITLGDERFQLFAVRGSGSLVVDEGTVQRHVVGQGEGLDARFAFVSRPLGEVTGKMTGGGGRSAVAGDEDGIGILPGSIQQLDGCVDGLARQSLDDRFHVAEIAAYVGCVLHRSGIRADRLLRRS